MKVFSSCKVDKTVLQNAAKNTNVNLDTEIQSISAYAKKNASESLAEVVHKELLVQETSSLRRLLNYAKNY